MKSLKLFFAAMVAVFVVSCEKPNVDEPTPDTPKTETVKFNVAYSLTKSNGVLMSKATAVETEIYAKFYAGMTAAELIPATYNLVFVNVETQESYILSGEWASTQELPVGTYTVTGTSTAEGQYIQRECSITLSDKVVVESTTTSLTLSAAYDAALVVFDDSDLVAMYNYNGTEKEALFTLDTYYYAFVNSKPAADGAEGAFIAKTATKELALGYDNAQFEKGKYYIYSDFIEGDQIVTGDFNLGIVLPDMEDGTEDVVRELPFVSEGDYEFLKAIVDGKLLGDATPVVEDWYNFDPACFEGTGFTLNVTEEGQIYVLWIQNVKLTEWPEKMHLAKCDYIHVRDIKTFAGKELPQDWNTPNLTLCSIVNTEATGTIPEGLASTTPNLNQLYLDGNDLYGALPHNWASKKLEVVLLANSNNHGAASSHRDHTMNNPGLGYMVPASLDVILNENRVAQGDKTQIKLGGTCNGNYIGFEKGWGQERYEKYAENAEAGNTAVWDDMRLLIGNDSIKFTDKDGYEQGSSWAWYYSNLGYTGMAMDIPHEMLDWDQAAADAYTAQCRAERGL